MMLSKQYVTMKFIEIRMLYVRVITSLYKLNYSYITLSHNLVHLTKYIHISYYYINGILDLVLLTLTAACIYYNKVYFLLCLFAFIHPCTTYDVNEKLPISQIRLTGVQSFTSSFIFVLLQQYYTGT